MDSLSTSRRGRLIPATLTRASILPYFSTTASAMALTASPLVTSHLTHQAPSRSSPVATVMSAMTAFAPAATRVCTVCFAMPDAPPVTMTTRSSSFSQPFSISLFLLFPRPVRRF